MIILNFFFHFFTYVLSRLMFQIGPISIYVKHETWNIFYV